MKEDSRTLTVPNALTIDVEDYFHVEAFAGQISPNDWHAFPQGLKETSN